MDVRVCLILGLFSAVLVSVPVAADLRFSGNLKNFSFVQESFEVGPFDIDQLYSSQQSGRVMLDFLEDNWAFQFHYEAGRDFRSDAVPFNVKSQGSNTYRLSDIERTPGDSDNKSITQQNLDRMNFQWHLTAGDLTLGRQAITFGSARIINPTDVFLPFDVQTLNTEYRAGIDAIRFQRPVGQLSEFDIGLVLGDDGSENSAAFARLKSNYRGSDIELTMIRFSQQTLMGIGLETTLGQFGAWVEAASVSGDEDYTRASLGLDYGFNESWFGMIEYHYNGAGSDDPIDYQSLFSTSPYKAGGVFLLGQHYLIPVISWQVSPLTSASLQVIHNLEDGSTFTNPGVDISLSDNLYLGLNLFVFRGKSASKSLPITLKSEYGGNPNRGIVSLRYYF